MLNKLFTPKENGSLRSDKIFAAHNKSTNIQNSFSVEYFVLVLRDLERGSKLNFKWFRSFRMASVYSSLVCGVTLLRGGKIERMHSARLVKYQDSLH